MFLTYFFLSFQGTFLSMIASPASGTSIPERILIVVDLPAPLGPIYPTISPFLIENDISLTASIYLYFLLKNDFKAPNFPFFLLEL